MDNLHEDYVSQTVTEFDQLAGSRGTRESHWEEIAGRVYPAYYGSFSSGGSITPGEKRTQQQYDSTAAIARGRFSSVMESMLTPRNSFWHSLINEDSVLKRNRQVRLYFEDVTRLLFRYRYAPQANFSSQNHQNYEALGAFGTGCMFIDELANAPGVRYRAIHLGEIYFAENHQGIIDKAYRKFEMTARQIKQKWGEDRIPEKVKTELEQRPETKFFILHCVKPREDVDVTRRDYRGMPFASTYIFLQEKALLSEGGYNTFPYAISRYTQTVGELYGRSPAMEALPAIKSLNEEKKTMLKQGHRAVDPVLLLHDDGILDTFSLKPGTANPGAVSKDGRPLVHTLPVGNLAAGQEMMAMEQQIIKDAFLVTIFQILTESPQMTATEVIERTQEKGILLSPTMGRQMSEYLGPMIDREIDVLSRQGLLPAMPAILEQAGAEYAVQYSSPLARAQRSEEAAGFLRTIDSALTVINVTQDPSPLDNFDMDEAIREISEIQAVPERWKRSLDAVDKMRDDRAQQAKEQQMIDAAPAVASVAKTVGGQ